MSRLRCRSGRMIPDFQVALVFGLLVYFGASCGAWLARVLDAREWLGGVLGGVLLIAVLGVLIGWMAFWNLFAAIDMGWYRCLRLMLRMGASPDQRDYRGRTPLESALIKKDLRAATILMEHGAEPSAIRSPEGLEAWREARSRLELRITSPRGPRPRGAPGPGR